MNVIEKQYDNGIVLSLLDTKKFKTNYFSLTFVLPLDKKILSNAVVLSSLLQRGCEKYPTLKKINEQLAALYDTSVGVSASYQTCGTLFKITASFLDDKFALDDKGIISPVLELIKEMLFRPLAKNGQMNEEYTSAEKKRALDAIRAEKNNKDRYALRRASEIAYANTPFATSQMGDADEVSAVTPHSLYRLLECIVQTGTVYAAYSGNCTDKVCTALDDFFAELSAKRTGFVTENPVSRYELPSFEKEQSVTEEIAAKQGRLVMNYSFPKADFGDVSFFVFNEMFGQSPVSRLFANVREKLSLCYYCASNVNISTSRMIVRSGLDEENKGAAITEIDRQLALLCVPENISAEELDMAKKSVINTYKAVKDSCVQYAEWYIVRKIYADPNTDIDYLTDKVNSVSAEEVSAVARKMKRELVYFLKGNEV